MKMKRWDCLLKRLPEEAKNGVEVGVYEGEFSKRIKEARPNLNQWMVDIWQPYEDKNGDGELTKFGKRLIDKEYMLLIGRQAMQVAIEYGCSVMVLKSTEAAGFFKNGTLDYVFIDAAHDYENVKADVEAWLPKVKKGGIIGGHNYKDKKYPGVKKAVDELLDVETDSDTTWWHYV